MTDGQSDAQRDIDTSQHRDHYMTALWRQRAFVWQTAALAVTTWAQLATETTEAWENLNPHDRLPVSSEEFRFIVDLASSITEDLS